MGDGKSKFRVVFSAIVCAISITLNALFFISTGFENKTTSFKIESDIPQMNFYNSIDEVGLFKSNDTEKQATTTSSNTSQAAVQAISDGTVKGKVIEKFISPYTANTSYENVYLKNSTDLKIDIKKLLSESLKYNIEKSSTPQILIFHTHATESFLSTSRDYYTDKDLTRTTKENANMLALGDIVTDKLKSQGYGVIHDKTLHDYPSYNESYSRAAKTINTYLKKYPSIKIVIDMHRDAISSGDTDKVKVTTEIGGKKAAQVMLVMGSQSGSVKNFPNWKENLKLAVRLQQKLESMYPSLARSVSLMPKNYNESLSTGSILVEMGTDGNSLEEVKYSAELLSNSLCALLDEI